MQIYFTVFFILVFLSFCELFCHYSYKTKKLTIGVLTALYIVLSSIYAGPMGDYNEYKRYFLSISWRHFFDIHSNRFEYLYEVVNIIVRSFSDNYIVLRLVLALIVLLLWYRIYTYWKDEGIKRYAITIMLIAWALMFGFIFIIRSVVALTFCIYSIRFIEQKKPFRFILCTVIAFGFHSMALLWFAAYVIYNNRRMKKILYIFIIITFCLSSHITYMIRQLSPILGSSISTRINIYLGDSMQSGAWYSVAFVRFKAIANIVLLMVVFEYILYRKNKMKTIKYEISYYNVYLTGAWIYMISLLSTYYLSRAAMPFTMMQVFLLPRIYDLPEIKNDEFIKLLTFIFLVIYLFLRMYLTLKGQPYVPFNTII